MINGASILSQCLFLRYKVFRDLYVPGLCYLCFHSPTEILIYMVDSICDLFVQAWSGWGIKTVHHIINRNLIITPAVFASTCWHLFEQCRPVQVPEGLGFISYLYCLVFSWLHQAEEYCSGYCDYLQYERNVKIPAFQFLGAALYSLHTRLKYVL